MAICRNKDLCKARGEREFEKVSSTLSHSGGGDKREFLYEVQSLMEKK